MSCALFTLSCPETAHAEIIELSSPSQVAVGASSQPVQPANMTLLSSLTLSNGGEQSHSTSTDQVRLDQEVHLNMVSYGSAGTPTNYAWRIYPNNGENSVNGTVTGSESGSSDSLFIDRPMIYGDVHSPALSGSRIFSLLYAQPVAGGGNRSPIVPANTSFYVKYGAMTLKRFSYSVSNSLLNAGNARINYVNVFVATDASLTNWVYVEPGADGYYSYNKPIYGIQTCMQYNAPFVSGAYQTHFYGINDLPQIYIIDSTTGAVEDQTDEIMSTDGSDSIVGGETSGGEQGLLDRFGFLGQTVGWVGDIFTAFQTTDEQSSLSFPGVQADVWGYQFGIPAFSVDIWQSCPVLEVPCRTFTTIVAVFLWVKGMFAAWTNFLSTGHWGLPEVHVEDDAE